MAATSTIRSAGKRKATAPGSNISNLNDNAGSSTLSVDPRIFVDPAHLTDQVFVAHSRSLLSARWACTQHDPSPCFVDGFFHGTMTEDDVDMWASGMAVGKETVDRPPSSLLFRWRLVGYHPGEFANAPHDLSEASPSFSVVSFSSSHMTADSDSDSFHALNLTIVPGIQGLGSVSGRAIEGLGNLILGLITVLDRRYRMRRLRGTILALKRADINVRSRGFHRVLCRFIAPRRQLNALMDDIIEYRIQRPYNDCLYTIVVLSMILDRNKAPLTTYARMKWMAISSAHGYNHKNLALLSLFSEEFDDEADAVRRVHRHLTRQYTQRLRTGRGMQLTDITKLLLSQDGEPGDALFGQRDTQWQGAFLVGRRICPTLDSLPRLDGIILKLYNIQRYDPYGLFDADPSSDLSIWKETCDTIGAMCHQQRSYECLWRDSTLYLVDIMSNVHPIRRPSLRATNALVPLVENVPNRHWREILGCPDNERRIEDILHVPTFDVSRESVQRLKSIVLQLARDFQRGEEVRSRQFSGREQTLGSSQL